jgi:hypothetical protein
MRFLLGPHRWLATALLQAVRLRSEQMTGAPALELARSLARGLSMPMIARKLAGLTGRFSGLAQLP